MHTDRSILIILVLSYTLAACGGGGGGGGSNAGSDDTGKTSSFSNSVLLKNGGQTFDPVEGNPPSSTQTQDDPEIRGNPKSIIENVNKPVKISTVINAASPLSKLYLQVEDEKGLYFEITPSSASKVSASDTFKTNNSSLRADFEEIIEVDIPPDFSANLFDRQFCAQISAQDDNGRISETVETCLEVSKTKAPNVAPIADAGQDLQVKTNEEIRLNGSDSRDPDGEPITYQWKLTKRPKGSQAKLRNLDTPIARFSADVAGEYRAQLMVNDTREDSHTDTVKITASTDNNAPVADAGSDINALTGEPVSPNGSDSKDADGDPITFNWTLFSQPDGSSATLDDTSLALPTLTADLDGKYVLVLVVSDGKADSEPDTVIVTATNANSAPIADAGADDPVPVEIGKKVNLDGSGSRDNDEDDTLTYRWLLKSKPTASAANLENITTVNPSFTPDKEGEYSVELIVNDGELDSKPDTAIFIAQQGNSPPFANAGEDQETVIGNIVQLDGSKSTDPEGNPLIFTWNVKTRPTASTAEILNNTLERPTFVADLVGEYLLELVVGDGELQSEPDIVVVQAKENPKPVANAGEDRSNVVINTQVDLDGSQSSDPGGENITFSWSFQSIPSNSQAVLVNISTPTTSFTPDVPGQYIVQLVVTDPIGQQSDPDTVTVTTQNQSPTISSIAAQTVDSGQTMGPISFTIGDAETPASDLTVEASSSNKNLVPDENISIEGTGSDRTITIVTVANLTGISEITLNVTDTAGATASATFQLTVQQGTTNSQPTFTSQPELLATVGQTYTYNIVATDPDSNDILTISAPTTPSWLTFQDNGNGTATLQGTPSADNVGPQNVELQVVDDGTPQQSNTQSFTIQVNSGENQSPTFNSSPVTTATVGETYTYNIVVEDPDADNILTITAPTIPAWLNLQDNGNGTATLSGAPGTGDVGSAAVVIQVVDNGTPQGSNTQSFTIQVSDSEDQPPTIISLGAWK